ncbi:t-SNARE affecting a late Golgi compartment protein 2 [Grifola frondosa]|uniref:t-SNARE affecting a late Golgi compartment protein 2 n=1 Tax=Grifola frondosa TaxID=5627 RepID=A0A1C7LRV3_GRIFR|nr:t-SNARE affecting a late Golgi compartment protein 2 [Grifola frondosa]
MGGYRRPSGGILAGTQAKIALLDRLHAKHVLPGFTDRSVEEREIEAATTEITKEFRQCHALIQRIGTAPPHAFPPSHAGQSHHEDLASKNVQRGLAAKVQELSATFRKKQRVYMEKLQGHAIKNQDLLIASGVVSLKGSEGLSAVDEDVEAAAASRSGSIAQDLLAPDVDLRTRDRELTEIAKSIASLAELFKDLSALVIDQGTLLDSVEYNIEQTAVQMSEAVKELNVATRYQKNTGRRQCIFLLLLIIFGLIIALIFKPRRHHPPSSTRRRHIVRIINHV